MITSHIPPSSIDPFQWSTIDKWFAMEARKSLYCHVQLVDPASAKSFCHSILNPLDWHGHSNPGIHVITLSLAFYIEDPIVHGVLLATLAKVIPLLTKITSFSFIYSHYDANSVTRISKALSGPIVS